VNPKSFHLALELDRCLKLDLNNAQFYILVRYIDSQKDGRKFVIELMALQPIEIIFILNQLKSERLGE